jgi:hypothetical protein
MTVILMLTKKEVRLHALELSDLQEVLIVSAISATNLIQQFI